MTPRVTAPQPSAITVTRGPMVRVERGYREDPAPREVATSLSITRRWSGGPLLGRGVAFLALLGGLFGGLAWFVGDRFFTFMLGVIGAIASLPVGYYTLAELLNRTEIAIDAESLAVTHRPVRVAGTAPVRLVLASIERIDVRPVQAGRANALVGYSLWARVRGRDVALVERPIPIEDARFLEQTLTAHLDDADERPGVDV